MKKQEPKAVIRLSQIEGYQQIFKTDGNINVLKLNQKLKDISKNILKKGEYAELICDIGIKEQTYKELYNFIPKDQFILQKKGLENQKLGNKNTGDVFQKIQTIEKKEEQNKSKQNTVFENQKLGNQNTGYVLQEIQTIEKKEEQNKKNSQEKPNQKIELNQYSNYVQAATDQVASLKFELTEALNTNNENQEVLGTNKDQEALNTNNEDQEVLGTNKDQEVLGTNNKDQEKTPKLNKDVVKTQDKYIENSISKEQCEKINNLIKKLTSFSEKLNNLYALSEERGEEFVKEINYIALKLSKSITKLGDIKTNISNGLLKILEIQVGSFSSNLEKYESELQDKNTKFLGKFLVSNIINSLEKLTCKEENDPIKQITNCRNFLDSLKEIFDATIIHREDWSLISNIFLKKKITPEGFNSIIEKLKEQKPSNYEAKDNPEQLSEEQESSNNHNGGERLLGQSDFMEDPLLDQQQDTFVGGIIGENQEVYNI